MQGLKILSLLVLAILVASTVSSAIRAEAQTPSGSKAASNWEYINHDSWGSNYSPQYEINKENVKDLEIRWIFPFPEAATFARNQPGVVPFEGAITPPLIVNGTVYVASNMRNVYSFDLKTGQMNWVNVYN